jgi:hypothetical protein
MAAALMPFVDYLTRRIQVCQYPLSHLIKGNYDVKCPSGRPSVTKVQFDFSLGLGNRAGPLVPKWHAISRSDK